MHRCTYLYTYGSIHVYITSAARREPKLDVPPPLRALAVWKARPYTLRRGGVTWRYLGCFARDMYETTASAVRCDMVLHRVSRARHL